MEKDIDVHFACFGEECCLRLIANHSAGLRKNSVLLWLRAFLQTSVKTSILKKADTSFRIRVVGDNSGYRRKLRNLPRFDPRQERDDGAGMPVLFDQPQIQP